jgi:hypothetical protein
VLRLISFPSFLQAVTRVKPYICTMPLRMDEGWNQIQLNLADLTRRAYGTNYVETLRVQVHANCRLRRIYFSDRLYSEEELPPEFKLYLPMQVRSNQLFALANFGLASSHCLYKLMFLLQKAWQISWKNSTAVMSDSRILRSIFFYHPQCQIICSIFSL